MRSVTDAACSEPRGRPENYVHFAGTLVFTSLSVYAWTVDSAAPGAWLLVMAAATALAGVAESLPTSFWVKVAADQLVLSNATGTAGSSARGSR